MSHPKVSMIPATLPFNGGNSGADKLKVAAYCRVSTDQEEQLNSYQAQIAYYSAYIRQKPEWTFAGVFADEGISGTGTQNRREFNRMIEACKAGHIDMVLTKSISRFARNTVDCLVYIRQLKDLGIPVYFEKENINTLDATGEFVITILGSLAQEESRNISTNIRWALEKRYQSGAVKLAPLYGYHKKPDGKLAIDPETAAIVKHIYKLYLEGYSLKKIKAYLESARVKSPGGHPCWHTSTIGKILKNEKYTGDAILQKTYTTDYLTHQRKKNNGEVKKYYVKNCLPPIITKDTFNRVQAELIRRRTVVAASEKAVKYTGAYNSKYALTKRIRCGECGKHYKRIIWHAYQHPKAVWRCQNRYDHGKKYCTNSPTIDEASLNHALLHALLSMTTVSEEVIPILLEHLLIALTPSRHAVKNKLSPLSCEAQRTEAIETKESLNPRITAIKTWLYEFNFETLNIEDLPIRELIESIVILQKQTIQIIFKNGAEITETLA